MAQKTPIRPASGSATPGEKRDPVERSMPRAASVERLTIPVKDGKIDWDGVRSTRRDALRQLLRDSGIEPAAAAAPADKASPLVNQTLCNTLYELVAQVESIAAVRMFGCTMDQAFKYLHFTDAEKAGLAEPTIAVLNKYIPASLLDKYADECMLLLLLATHTRSKFGALRAALAKDVSPRRPATVTPIHRDDEPGDATPSDDESQ